MLHKQKARSGAAPCSCLHQSGPPLCLFTCSQRRGRQDPRRAGHHVSHRGREPIVPGWGGGQAAALPPCFPRPIQAGDQQRRRQREEQQQRRQVASSGGHVGRGGRLKDITRREEGARGGERGPSCVCPRHEGLVPLVGGLVVVGGNGGGTAPRRKDALVLKLGVWPKIVYYGRMCHPPIIMSYVIDSELFESKMKQVWKYQIYFSTSEQISVFKKWTCGPVTFVINRVRLLRTIFVKMEGAVTSLMSDSQFPPVNSNATVYKLQVYNHLNAHFIKLHIYLSPKLFTL